MVPSTIEASHTGVDKLTTSLRKWKEPTSPAGKGMEVDQSMILTINDNSDDDYEDDKEKNAIALLENDKKAIEEEMKYGYEKKKRENVAPTVSIRGW